MSPQRFGGRRWTGTRYSTLSPQWPADAFLVVANHWKSKTDDSDPLYPSDTEDTSSPAVDQGAFKVTRAREVQDTLTFANQVAASLVTNRIFIVGDLNSYIQEDPLQSLHAAGCTDLGGTFNPSEGTYSLNGLAGSAIWAPSRVFTAGDVVVHQGKKYVASGGPTTRYQASHTGAGSH